MPQDAGVGGRLIGVRIGRGQSQQWLHVFTTLLLPQAEVVDLYGRRWNIETDLRSLKRTVSLHHVAARNESMMGKELLTARGFRECWTPPRRANIRNANSAAPIPELSADAPTPFAPARIKLNELI